MWLSCIIDILVHPVASCLPPGLATSMSFWDVEGTESSFSRLSGDQSCWMVARIIKHPKDIWWPALIRNDACTPWYAHVSWQEEPPQACSVNYGYSRPLPQASCDHVWYKGLSWLLSHASIFVTKLTGFRGGMWGWICWTSSRKRSAIWD